MIRHSLRLCAVVYNTELELEFENSFRDVSVGQRRAHVPLFHQGGCKCVFVLGM